MTDALTILLSLLVLAGGGPRSGTRPTDVAVPDIVAHGRPPGVRACASCHLPNGFGRPETASLAGQPAAYIEEQMAEYRRGARSSLNPTERGATMSDIAAAVTDDEIRAAAAYFAAVPYEPWIQVVETGSIGDGIVEVPADRGFVASVPPGSVRRGELLVTTGAGGRTVRCALCHGEGLNGLHAVPGIAGRSPSYQLRQLRDMQRGLRQGLGPDLMKPTVARLTDADMIAIVAYTASVRP